MSVAVQRLERLGRPLLEAGGEGQALAPRPGLPAAVQQPAAQRGGAAGGATRGRSEQRSESGWPHGAVGRPHMLISPRHGRGCGHGGGRVQLAMMAERSGIYTVALRMDGCSSSRCVGRYNMRTYPRTGFVHRARGTLFY
jgi:hypothetical protein